MIHSKKVFLTGERNVGKTTLITKFIEEIDIIPKGFSTVFGKASAENDYVYIIPYGTALDIGKAQPVAKRDLKAHNITKYPEIFDIEGVKILEASKNSDFIVMDELGFMESESLVFQQRVLSCLDADIPVLGVIKPKKMEFLDKVRGHKSVKVIEVTPENREDLLFSLKEIFCE